MKKITIAIILFCTLYSAHSLDYRQVIFGNSYQNIIEIDADAFFEQYPEVKEYNAGSESGGTTRVYEQVIGEKIFYRVLLSYEKLTEADFLDWKNLEFVQVVYFKKSNTHLLQVGKSNSFKHIDYDDNPVYTGLEIIERNNNVIGIMRYTLSESDSFNNNAKYWSWQNLLDNQRQIEEWPLTISYAFLGDTNLETIIIITASNSLVDSRRPFMYTIQNAFDGNPATSYVENTDDDIFFFEIEMWGRDYDEVSVCTSYKIINGYASGNYYYQNNQIAKVAVFGTSSNGNKSYYTHDSFQLHDTVKTQIMNFNGLEIYQNQYTTFGIRVEELTNGTLYNDTAMAEFDIYIEGEGWLFGSSDTNTVVASPATPNQYEYTIKDDGTAEIVDLKWRETDEVTIPSIIEYRGKTYTVTSIGKSVFSSSSLTSVTIPDSVISIGDSAFYYCYNLTSVTIPDSVTSIGSAAFGKCQTLPSIIIPNSVTSIGNSAFESCQNLTSVTMSNTVTSIGNWAFAYCSSLTSITIPSSVTSIGDSAFEYCTSLTSITIPSSVTSIGYMAFKDCENLTVSVFPDSYALEYVQENNIPYILVN